jgi:hypothetical protein
MRSLGPAALLYGLAGAFSLAQPHEAVITGMVVEDHSSAPVPGAVVRLFQSGEGGVALKELETTREGRFELGALPPGPYRIEVAKANYVSTTVTLDAWRATATDEVAAFRLVRHGVIAGRTIPAGSAQIVAVETVPSGIEPRRFSAVRSESNAEFRVFNLPPASYVLAAMNGATDKGLRHGVTLYPSSAQPQAFSIAGGEQYLDIEMPIPSGEAFTVRGRVIASDLPPTQSVALTLRAADQPWGLVWSRLLRANDEIQIDNLVPGRYELSARSTPGGRLSGSIRFDLDRPGLDALELPLEPVPQQKSKSVGDRSKTPAAIRGAISGASAPMFVTLVDRTPGRTGRIRASLVRPGAGFSFAMLEPGTYHLAAHRIAARDARWLAPSSASADRIDLAAGESRTIDVRAQERVR